MSVSDGRDYWLTKLMVGLQRTPLVCNHLGFANWSDLHEAYAAMWDFPPGFGARSDILFTFG